MNILTWPGMAAGAYACYGGAINPATTVNHGPSVCIRIFAAGPQGYSAESMHVHWDISISWLITRLEGTDLYSVLTNSTRGLKERGGASSPRDFCKFTMYDDDHDHS